MKALVIGGGIGGVTLALCLLEAGIEVSLFERNPAIVEIGAGIQLSPNAARVLEKLNLLEDIGRIAFQPLSLDMRLGHSGTRIFSIPIRERAASQFGAPYYHVHRADLMDALLGALQQRHDKALHLNKTLVSFSQDASGVKAKFDDGTEASGDILIGADGIHSVVRSQLQGETPARFTGNIAWRLVVPASPELKKLVPPSATIWVGPGRHAVTYYLRLGELINFVGVVERDDWQKESWTEPGEVQQLRSDYAGWAKPVTTLIAEAQSCHRWALFDRNPLESWSEGRVSLLGDACHPMLPFLAQGAAMCIEDAWVLSRKLKLDGNVPDLLAAYEAERKPRTSRAQLGSRRQMGLYHQRSLFSQLTTYGPMWLAAHLTPAYINSRQDWLYGHDVTANRS